MVTISNPAVFLLKKLRFVYKKKQWRPPSKKKKRGKNLSPRNRKACHSVSTALLLKKRNNSLGGSPGTGFPRWKYVLGYQISISYKLYSLHAHQISAVA
jgi:hypothetical protein